MNTIKRLAARSIARVMAWLKNNPRFKELYASLTYESVNRDQFSGVGEQEKMLADEVRFDAYRRAIAKHVRKGDIVLDVGTGSGVLSFIAATQEPSKIFAIDHSNFIEVARYIAERNGIENIDFMNVHSRKFDPPQKVDIIIHEQMGSGLFDENMVETLVDLRDRVLRDGGKIIPAEFELYMEPVQLKDENRVPFIWDHKYQNADYACLKDLWREKHLSPNLMRYIQKYEVDYLLADPEKLFACDLQAMEPDGIPKEFQFRRIVQRAGRLDGVCLFFRAIFDEDSSLSTFPHCARTHWGTPSFRVESRSCHKGEVLEFQMKIDDIRDMGTWSLKILP